MSITPGMHSDVSILRAWLELLWLSIRRQARMRQMVWIALGLLFLAVLAVGLVTLFGSWTLADRRVRMPPGRTQPATQGASSVATTAKKSTEAPPKQSNPSPSASPIPLRPRRLTYQETIDVSQVLMLLGDRGGPVQAAVSGSLRVALVKSSFLIFSRWIVFAIFQSFLLPLLTLSFATDALGAERENRTLTWLFTRPLPKPAIYFAKYLAALPWCLSLNLFGFVAICLAGGEPGVLALRLFWPAVACGTLAYAALFHLIAALFRRPAVVGLVYSFFFEMLVGDLPGDLKRMSLSYYIRSLMFDATASMGLSSDQLTVYNPVDGWMALAVLAGAVATFTFIGMIVFSRTEYREDV
jgi:ABC-type transport system involved in multi-copper enzyme maturation permease subunit